MVEKKKKILFIEDEATLQKAIGTFLEAEGFEVISVLDGDTGILMANKENPDLILLDLILPKKDGFEVLAELKANEVTKNIPVIVLTNLEGIGYVDRAIELGATTYLVKANYTLEEVIQKVKDALKGK